MSSASDVVPAAAPAGTLAETPVAVPAEACAVRVVDPEKVAVVSASLPGAETITELSQVFGLLSDPGRLRVITALLEGGEMCV